MNIRKIIAGLALPCAVAATVGLTLPAQATIGYFQHGYGARSIAMGGTGVASSNETLAIAINPARILNAGNRLDAGATLFAPFRGFEADSFGGFGVPIGGKTRSNHNYFIIPHFGYTSQIDENSAWGIAVYGNGGMNTQYSGFDRQCMDPLGNVFPASGVFCGGKAGVNLAQLFVAPTYAHKLSDRISVGITAIGAFQRFRLRGAALFGAFSQDPANLSNRGHDESFGYGFRIGIAAALTDSVNFGFSYQSRVYMGKFSKYRGIFADDGDFDVPQTMIGGLSWQPSENVTLEFNLQQIWYSTIKAVGNPFASPGLLGTKGGPGFGWKDITVFKFGAEMVADENWTMRMGYVHNDQPIPGSEVLFNVFAPAVQEDHFTVGFSRKLSDSTALEFSGMYSPSAKVSGANALNPAQNITLQMDQFALTFNWVKRF